MLSFFSPTLWRGQDYEGGAAVPPPAGSPQATPAAAGAAPAAGAAAAAGAAPEAGPPSEQGEEEFYECRSPTSPPYSSSWAAPHRVQEVHGQEAVEEALRFLDEHQGVIVCSFCAPDVFESFIQERLTECDALALRQLMRGVSGALSEQERTAFSDVVLGRRATSGREGLARRQGGLLQHDTRLLRGYLERNPRLAEYLALTQVNEYVISSLRNATAAWHREHPRTDMSEAERQLSLDGELAVNRVRIVNGVPRIRGSCLPALKRNLPSDSPELRVFERLYEALVGCAAFDTRLSLDVMRPRLTKLSLTDPHVPPSQLLDTAARTAAAVLKVLSSEPRPPDWASEAAPERVAALRLADACTEVLQLFARSLAARLEQDAADQRASAEADERAERRALAILEAERRCALDGDTLFLDCSDGDSADEDDRRAVSVSFDDPRMCDDSALDSGRNSPGSPPSSMPVPNPFDLVAAQHILEEHPAVFAAVCAGREELERWAEGLPPRPRRALRQLQQAAGAAESDARFAMAEAALGGRTESSTRTRYASQRRLQQLLSEQGAAATLLAGMQRDPDTAAALRELSSEWAALHASSSQEGAAGSALSPQSDGTPRRRRPSFFHRRRSGQGGHSSQSGHSAGSSHGAAHGGGDGHGGGGQGPGPLWQRIRGAVRQHGPGSLWRRAASAVIETPSPP